jgi:poly(A) polymerase
MEKIYSILTPFIKTLLKKDGIHLVGGAIRDAILGLELSDFDFAVPGSGIGFARWFAKEIKGRFVLLDEERDEGRVVYRKKLTFDFNGMEDIESDLSRRDFTMNSMAIKLPNSHLLDPFNGKKDIQHKKIKMIKDEALRDDPLRILRAFRFQATLGFDIEEETQKAMKNYKELLHNVAKERIRNEFFPILEYSASNTILFSMAKSGVLDIILKEVTPMRNVPQNKRKGNLLRHSILTVKRMEHLNSTIRNMDYIRDYLKDKMPILKLAALLHDIGKPSCMGRNKKGKLHFYGHDRVGEQLINKSVREEIKLTNKELKSLSILIRYHMRPHLLARESPPTQRAIYRLVKDAGADTPGLLLLAYADAFASREIKKKNLLQVIKMGINTMKEMSKPKFKRLLTGHDLIAMGLEPGPIFKKILDEVEEAQVAGHLKTKGETLSFIRQKFLSNSL